jgi:hypothetical protein
MNPSASPEASLWERILKRHTDKMRLTEMDMQTFGIASLEQLHSAIAIIQEKHAQSRKLQAMKRLEKFLSAMEDYGKVIEVFGQTSSILGFVWVCLQLPRVACTQSCLPYQGPMKFVLQVASNYSTAFNTILDAYEQIGESMPQLIQYQTFFRENTYMAKVLALLFEDILGFHLEAVKHFKKRCASRQKL